MAIFGLGKDKATPSQSAFKAHLKAFIKPASLISTAFTHMC